MCTYLTHMTEIHGAGRTPAGRIDLRRAVVSFDHPQDAALEHALCIDLRSDTDPAARVAVELDAASARRLAEAILATLGADEVRTLL